MAIRNAKGQFVSPQLDTAFIAKDIMNQVAKQARRQISASFGEFAKNMNRRAASKADLERLHNLVALEAQGAMLNAYRTSGIGKRPSYRWNDPGKLRRYSNKAMIRGLQDSRLIRSDFRGVQFFDRSVMDSHAKQWYRLNFGASPRGSKAPSVGSMKFFGRVIPKKASLAAYGPSRGFRVPHTPKGRGIWSNTFLPSFSQGLVNPVKKGATGKGALYVFFGRKQGMLFTSTNANSRKRKRGVKTERHAFLATPMSRGIQGARFIDAGIKTINERYPLLMTQMIKEWTAASKAGIKRTNFLR